MSMPPNRDDQALLRALQVERATRKLYERYLRDMMAPNDFQEFRFFARQRASRDVELKCLAKLTTNGPDAV